MLHRTEGLPPNVDGIRAAGTVTREDYENIFKPLLQAAHRDGRRMRLLYEFPREFKGFTAGAGLEDAYLVLKYLRLFERCAIVTDVTWIREGSRLFAALMPCPVKVFTNAERPQAIEWVSGPPRHTVPHRLLKESGVLVVEPAEPLRAEDFDALAMTVDPWLEAAGTLRGIVVHTRAFPGWQNVGSLLRHIRFVRDHHRRIARVAVAADGMLAEVTPALADPFVEAELRHFGYDQLDAAIAWAGSTTP